MQFLWFSYVEYSRKKLKVRFVNNDGDIWWISGNSRTRVNMAEGSSIEGPQRKRLLLHLKDLHEVYVRSCPSLSHMSYVMLEHWWCSSLLFF